MSNIYYGILTILRYWFIFILTNILCSHLGDRPTFLIEDLQVITNFLQVTEIHMLSKSAVSYNMTITPSVLDQVSRKITYHPSILPATPGFIIRCSL
jgi:hypothetical protein